MSMRTRPLGFSPFVCIRPGNPARIWRKSERGPSRPLSSMTSSRPAFPRSIPPTRTVQQSPLIHRNCINSHQRLLSQAAVAEEPHETPTNTTSDGPLPSNLEKLTVKELKDLLSSRSLKTSGVKSELVERLQSAAEGHATAQQDETKFDPSPAVTAEMEEPSSTWSKMTVKDLKARLTELGLSTTGLKNELIERLQSASSQESQSTSMDELHTEPSIEEPAIQQLQDDDLSESLETVVKVESTTTNAVPESLDSPTAHSTPQPSTSTEQIISIETTVDSVVSSENVTDSEPTSTDSGAGTSSSSQTATVLESSNSAEPMFEHEVVAENVPIPESNEVRNASTSVQPQTTPTEPAPSLEIPVEPLRPESQPELVSESNASHDSPEAKDNSTVPFIPQPSSLPVESVTSIDIPLEPVHLEAPSTPPTQQLLPTLDADPARRLQYLVISFRLHYWESVVLKAGLKALRLLLTTQRTRTSEAEDERKKAERERKKQAKRARNERLQMINPALEGIHHDLARSEIRRDVLFKNVNHFWRDIKHDITFARATQFPHSPMLIPKPKTVQHFEDNVSERTMSLARLYFSKAFSRAIQNGPQSTLGMRFGDFRRSQEAALLELYLHTITSRTKWETQATAEDFASAWKTVLQEYAKGEGQWFIGPVSPVEKLPRQVPPRTNNFVSTQEDSTAPIRQVRFAIPGREISSRNRSAVENLAAAPVALTLSLSQDQKRSFLLLPESDHIVGPFATDGDPYTQAYNSMWVRLGLMEHILSITRDKSTNGEYKVTFKSFNAAAAFVNRVDQHWLHDSLTGQVYATWETKNIEEKQSSAIAILPRATLEVWRGEALKASVPVSEHHGYPLVEWSKSMWAVIKRMGFTIGRNGDCIRYRTMWEKKHRVVIEILFRERSVLDGFLAKREHHYLTHPWKDRFFAKHLRPIG